MSEFTLRGRTRIDTTPQAITILQRITAVICNKCTSIRHYRVIGSVVVCISSSSSSSATGPESGMDVAQHLTSNLFTTSLTITNSRYHILWIIYIHFIYLFRKKMMTHSFYTGNEINAQAARAKGFVFISWQSGGNWHYCCSTLDLDVPTLIPGTNKPWDPN